VRGQALFRYQATGRTGVFFPPASIAPVFKANAYPFRLGLVERTPALPRASFFSRDGGEPDEPLIIGWLCGSIARLLCGSWRSHSSIPLRSIRPLPKGNGSIPSIVCYKLSFLFSPPLTSQPAMNARPPRGPADPSAATARRRLVARGHTDARFQGDWIGQSRENPGCYASRVTRARARFSTNKHHEIGSGEATAPPHKWRLLPDGACVLTWRNRSDAIQPRPKSR